MSRFCTRDLGWKLSSRPQEGASRSDAGASRIEELRDELTPLPVPSELAWFWNTFLEIIGDGRGTVEVEVECPGFIPSPPEVPDTCNVDDARTIAASDDPAAMIDAMVARRVGDITNAPRIRRMVTI